MITEVTREELKKKYPDNPVKVVGFSSQDGCHLVSILLDDENRVIGMEKSADMMVFRITEIPNTKLRSDISCSNGTKTRPFPWQEVVR